MNQTVKYLISKFLKMVFTIWVVTTLIFVLIRMMPSNPIDRYIEDQMIVYGVSYEDASARAKNLFSIDLNEPIWKQYLSYMVSLMSLDFGTSLLSPGIPVMEIIASRLPWTLLTVGSGLLLSFIVGIVIGALMAYKRDKWYEPVITGFCSFLSAIPDFLIAIFLIIIFGVIKFGGNTLIPIKMLRGTYSMGVKPGFNFAFIKDLSSCQVTDPHLCLFPIRNMGFDDERKCDEFPELRLRYYCKSQRTQRKNNPYPIYWKKCDAAYCHRIRHENGFYSGRSANH